MIKIWFTGDLLLFNQHKKFRSLFLGLDSRLRTKKFSSITHTEHFIILLIILCGLY